MRKDAVEAARYGMIRALCDDPAFGGVKPAILTALVESTELRAVSKGHVIYEGGQNWGHLGFVVDGEIAMIAGLGRDKGHLYEQAQRGDFFGVSAVFDGGAEMARTIVISQKATYALVAADVVLDLCRENGPLAIAFAKTLARRIRRTTSLLAEQVSYSAKERIARYLMMYAQNTGLAPAADPLPLMTQAQIGAAAGTVKDVAARAIAAFEQAGALKRERGHVRWLNREILAAIAGGESKSPSAAKRAAGG